MKRLICWLFAAALLFAAPAALAQSSPGIYNGQVPTAAQWNSWFAAKQDVAPGLLSGPGAATPGHLVTWGAIYPATADGGAPPSVAAGTCMTVTGSPIYTVALTAACRAQRGYIDGLTLATAGSVRTFTVAVGTATDSTSAVLMSLGSAYTKTNASGWAAGSGNGCMDTGSSTVSTWYHIFLIEKTDLSVVDILCSLSATAPTMPAGYTFKRRIGSMFTTAGTANWTQFLQNGDDFRWNTPVNDINSAALSTTATNYTLSVPPGVIVTAKMRGYMASGSVGVKLVVTSPLVATPVAGTPAGEVTAVSQVAANPSAFVVDILTDTAQHATAVASAASTTIIADTFGWNDARGRNN